MIGRLLATWHNRRHKVTAVPDIYGGSRRVHYYCTVCPKEWVGR